MNFQNLNRDELLIALSELQQEHIQLKSSYEKDIARSKQIEAELKLSEYKYKNLVEYAIVGIYSTNLNGDLLFANNAMCQILEYDTVDELINFSVKCTYNDENERDKLVEAIKKSGQIYNHELELITKKGRKIDVLINSFISGDVITGMMMDITERKKSDEMLQDIIEKNPLSIQIVDHEGRTLKTNSAHTKLFGVEPPSDFSIFDDLSCKSQELKEIVMKAKSGEVVHFPDLYYNVHDVSPEFPDSPAWIRALIFPLKENKESCDKFVLMHENITERKLMEIALKESEASLEWSQGIAKMGSWEFEIETKKNTWSRNCFKLFEVNPEEVDPTFEYFKSRIHADDIHLIDEAFGECALHEQSTPTVSSRKMS
ncbi:MAG: PAS domain S-box protein, partial [Bacteroidales bacterium]